MAACCVSSTALSSRGTCTYVNKTQNAAEAGAVAVLVSNDHKDGIMIMGGSPHEGRLAIPAVSISRKTGEKLTAAAPLRSVRLRPYERPLFDTSVILIFFIAIGSVWAGARWSSTKERAEAQGRLDQLDQRDEPQDIAYVNERAAYCFVVVASLSLLVLFYFIANLIYLLIALFAVGGASGLHALLMPLVRKYAPVGLERGVDIPFCGVFSRLDVLMCIPSWGFSICWVLARKESYAWVLQDVLAVALLLLLQRTLRLTSIKVSTILLVLAFLYDIFWVFLSPYVFGESVMVTVATGGDSGEAIPMLVRVPRFSDELHGYSMLGLGDVALPGLLVSFLLRYDYKRRLSGLGEGYFWISLIGYSVGLVITDLVLIVTQAAQPALLYLVPCTLGVVCFVAQRRGDLGDLWTGLAAPHDPSLLPETDVRPAYAEIDNRFSIELEAGGAFEDDDDL